jgi:hypothetical protein
MWAEDLVKIVDEIIIPGTGVQQAPSRFQSCFISYSHKDEEFVRHLYSALKSKRLQAWFAAEHMLPGRKLHEEIQNNIPLYDKLLLVLSRSSLNSNWVETEIRTAIAEERKTGRRKLLPIRIVGLDQITEWKCFDADSGKDIAAELREYLIPDFSTWRDTPAFDRNLRKLLEALRA